MPYGKGSIDGLDNLQECSSPQRRNKKQRHMTQQLQHLEGQGQEPSTAAANLSDLEKSLMSEKAADAMGELVQLLTINEPLWIRTATSGSYSLHRETYENFFPRENLKSTTVRFESSKDDCIVSLTGRQLVEIFVDPIKWVNLFPAIVMKASTILVLGTGVLGSNDSALQLMDVDLHNISTLVAARRFNLLRYCRLAEPGKWVIADVSYERSRQSPSVTRCWRLPSGCMIEDMPGGCSKVTWAEHVEVDDQIQLHHLYRDLVSSGAVYGAERWTVTLERMCERFTHSMSMSANQTGRVFISLEGKRGIKNLAHRTVKSFCAMLHMPGKADFPPVNGLSNSEVQVFVRENMESGQPIGIIVTAVASLWLPLSTQDVFNFFTDERTRTQWDTLCNYTPMHEITRIANGAHPGNSISILEPYRRDENQTLIFQETSFDRLGGLLVYAPVHTSAIDLALSGQNTSDIPILPSGIIISSDGRSNASSRCASSSLNPNKSSDSSLITIAFQMLVSNIPAQEEVDISAAIRSTVQRIKAALGCGDLD